VLIKRCMCWCFIYYWTETYIFRSIFRVGLEPTITMLES